MPSIFGGRRVLEELKKFALRGNVVDLAVGVVIGASAVPATAPQGVPSGAPAR